MAIEPSDILKLYQDLGGQIFEGSAGNVAVNMTGQFEVRSVALKIMKSPKKPVTLDAIALQKLESQLVAAFNAAIAQVRSAAAEASSKLGATTKDAPK